MESGKLIIISAPSGTGKSTIIHHLLQKGVPMYFSVSATSRAPRGAEVDGKDYHFMSEESFRELIAQDAFIEYEEVYPGRFYGTLKSELEIARQKGRAMILDIDVAGAVRVKEKYGDQALSIFLRPPSLEVLRERLEARGTDMPEAIAERVKKAAYELTFEPMFDHVVINEKLDQACRDVETIVTNYINTPSTLF